jgi:DNA repair ATPase RecN
MTDKEMLERTKLDLENFNSRVEILRQYELELNEFRKQEQPPQKEIDLLEFKIRRIELNIKY